MSRIMILGSVATIADRTIWHIHELGTLASDASAPHLVVGGASEVPMLFQGVSTETPRGGRSTSTWFAPIALASAGAPLASDIAHAARPDNIWLLRLLASLCSGSSNLRFPGSFSSGALMLALPNTRPAKVAQEAVLRLRDRLKPPGGLLQVLVLVLVWVKDKCQATVRALHILRCAICSQT